MQTNIKPLRILLVTSKYNRPEQGPYLTNDLANSWAADGHQVQAISLEWDGVDRTECYSDGTVRVLRIGPFVTKKFGVLIERLAKWALSSPLAMRTIRKEIGDDARYDLLVTMAPLVNLSSPLEWGLKRSARSYVYNADFFPYYHRSIGLVPGGPIFHAVRLGEQRLLRKFDVIGCMSAANIAFLKSHFRLAKGQRATALHLWGDTSAPPMPDRDAKRAQYGLPRDKAIALFGGQLIHGRGIEDILGAAELARSEAPDLLFLFIGRGRLEPLITDYMARGGDNVRVIPPLPRDEYLSVASACDIGVNATAAHVVVPTFPTKTIDYLRARIPIAASVEAASDYGEFVEDNGVGLTSPAGDPRALLGILQRMAEDPAMRQRMRNAAQPTLDKYLDVRVAARSIIEDCFG